MINIETETKKKIKTNLSALLFAITAALVFVFILGFIIGHYFSTIEMPVLYITSMLVPIILMLAFIAVWLKLEATWDKVSLSFFLPIIVCYVGYAIELNTTGFGPAQLFGIFNAKVSATLFNFSTVMSFYPIVYFASKVNIIEEFFLMIRNAFRKK
jgi:hypothetical protein